jgi:hypothetical protein
LIVPDSAGSVQDTMPRVGVGVAVAERGRVGDRLAIAAADSVARLGQHAGVGAGRGARVGVARVGVGVAVAERRGVGDRVRVMHRGRVGDRVGVAAVDSVA